MAQRKSPPPGKPTAKKGTSRPAGRAAGPAASATSAAKPSTARGNAGGSVAGKGATGRGSTGKGPTRPPAKKGKSIVNQKQRPWGLIATATAVVLFAVAIIVAVIATHKSGTSTSSGPTSTSKGGQAVNKNDPYRQPELPAAAKIQGVVYRVEGQHSHVTGVIKYDASPPVGGNHSQIWANCNGNIYDHQLANENAVHMLEHGAVWITYNPKTLPKSELTQLDSYVKGQDRTALSPYAGLKTPISLQAWGYQLFVNKASDPRIAQFIATLKYNQATTPENASCTDPYWNDSAAKSSKPGHPVEQ
jgi:uncharacterized protein DUF3105